MLRLVAALAIAVFSAPSLIGAVCVEQAKLDKYAKSYADCVASTINFTGVNLTLGQCLCADRFRVRRCLRWYHSISSFTLVFPGARRFGL